MDHLRNVRTYSRRTEQPGFAGRRRAGYRLDVGGNTPRYVCLRPRTDLEEILPDERVDRSLPDRVNGLIAKVTVETLNLRTNMLVNVTPEPTR